MREALTWEAAAPAIGASAARRHTLLLGGGLSLLPLLAAAGLALPLPSQVYRLAELVVERTVALGQALPGGGRQEPAPPALRVAHRAHSPAPPARPQHAQIRHTQAVSQVAGRAVRARPAAAPVTDGGQSSPWRVPEEPGAAKPAAAAAKSTSVPAATATSATGTPAVTQPSPTPSPPAPAPTPTPASPAAPAPTPTPAPAAAPSGAPATVTATADAAPPAQTPSGVSISAKASITAGPVSAEVDVTVDPRK